MFYMLVMCASFMLFIVNDKIFSVLFFFTKSAKSPAAHIFFNDENYTGIQSKRHSSSLPHAEIETEWSPVFGGSKPLTEIFRTFGAAQVRAAGAVPRCHVEMGDS